MTIRPRAGLFDRDGTTASCFARPVVPARKIKDRSGMTWKPDRDTARAKDAAWAAFNAALPFDAVVPWVVALMRSLRPGTQVLMASGRAEGDWPGDRRRRFQMQDWIVKHDLPIDHLFMRVGGDFRQDAVVKAEIFERDIRPFFDVRFAVDDRPQVCDVWRSFGIPVLQVTDPDLPPLIGG